MKQNPNRMIPCTPGVSMFGISAKPLLILIGTGGQADGNDAFSVYMILSIVYIEEWRNVWYNSNGFM